MDESANVHIDDVELEASGKENIQEESPALDNDEVRILISVFVISTLLHIYNYRPTTWTSSNQKFWNVLIRWYIDVFCNKLLHIYNYRPATWNYWRW